MTDEYTNIPEKYNLVGKILLIPFFFGDDEDIFTNEFLSLLDSYGVVYSFCYVAPEDLSIFAFKHTVRVIVINKEDLNFIKISLPEHIHVQQEINLDVFIITNDFDCV